MLDFGNLNGEAFFYLIEYIMIKYTTTTKIISGTSVTNTTFPNILIICSYK